MKAQIELDIELDFGDIKQAVKDYVERKGLVISTNIDDPTRFSAEGNKIKNLSCIVWCAVPTISSPNPGMAPPTIET